MTWGEGNGSRDQNHWHFVVKDVVENRIFLRHDDADEYLILRCFRSISPIDLVGLCPGSSSLCFRTAKSAVLVKRNS